MKSLSQKEFNLLSELLDHVIDMEPDDRIVFLENLDIPDRKVQDELALLVHILNESSDTFLSQKAATLGAGLLLLEPDFDFKIGDSIGPYEIVDYVGFGGMGSVYKAARADGQFERTVALKVIKSSFLQHLNEKRFSEERNVLAQMEHAHICRMYEGGVTQDGVLYLVMEYIDGFSLAEYLERVKPSIADRIDLFIKLCDAVRYAHSRAIIHGDLKPDNILVTNSGDPKLLDFGVARFLDSNPTDEIGYPGSLRLTPQYAAPEQLLGESTSTISDIYSLGIVLYELLTGTTPYQYDAFSLPKIRESLSAAKPASLRKFNPRISEDLDAIVIKCLAFDPEQRYQTVASLMQDLQRYQSFFPPHYVKTSWRSRARNRLKRNRIVISFAVVIASLTVFYLNSIFNERDIALAEAQKAEEVRTFLVDLFNISDPTVVPGDSLLARTILDEGARRLEIELSDQPEIKAEMMDIIGYIYYNLGLYDEAFPLVENAIELRTQLFGENNFDVTASMMTLALLKYDTDSFHEADSILRHVERIRRALLGDEHPEVAAALMTYGEVLEDMGNFVQAESLFTEAVTIHRGNPTDSAGLAVALNNLAYFLQTKIGDEAAYEEARAMYEEALYIRSQILPDEHPEIANSYNNLGYIYEDLELFDLARSNYEAALAIRRAILPATHPDLATSINNLGLFHRTQRDLDRAEALLREALVLDIENMGEFHTNVGIGKHNLAAVLQDQGKYAEAESLFREAIAIYERRLGPDHGYIGIFLLNLSEVLIDQGKLEEGEQALREAERIRRQVYGENHWRVSLTKIAFGRVHFLKKEYSAAQDAFTTGISELESFEGTPIGSLRLAYNQAIDFFTTRGDTASVRVYRDKLDELVNAESS